MRTEFVRHTRVVDIVGDITRVNATGAALGDLAVVDSGNGETSTATVVGIDRERVSIQVAEAQEFFTRLTVQDKNLNYSPPGSPEHERYQSEIERPAAERSPAAPAEA